MDDIRPSEWVRKFPIQGGLLLLDTNSDRLFAYNDSALFAWELIEAGRTVEHLEAEFARAWGIPRSRAQADLRSILAQWRMQGLIGKTERRPAVAGSDSAAAIDRDCAPPRWASEWICTIRGIPISFAVECDLPTVRPYLNQLETPSARPQTRLEIRGRGSTEAVLIRDGVERVRTSDPSVLVGGLWHSILECIHPDVHWRALIHGAALARDGIGLALAGPSGSGKTTLAAGLISRGFDYLSDDAVPVCEPDGAVVPWPLPLSIKPGSMELLKTRFSELRNATAYSKNGSEARLLVPAADVWDTKAVKLQTLVFPRFVEGAAPEQRRLSPFEVVQNLLTDRIWLGYPITEAKVKSFLGWLADTPSYAIAYGSLDDAIELVEGVIA